MKEITGDLWSFLRHDNYRVCITTNGFVKNNGECVMGRGCAFEAKQRWPQLPKLLGDSIKKDGNVLQLVYLPDAFLVAFPVKHRWFEKADIELIKKSANSLKLLSKIHPHLTFVLPRPGCGNGGLSWEEVKPEIEFLPDSVLVISK